MLPLLRLLWTALLLLSSCLKPGHGYSSPLIVRIQPTVTGLQSRSRPCWRSNRLHESRVDSSESHLDITNPSSGLPEHQLKSDIIAADAALDPQMPSYRSILVFVMTTVLIWLSEPLLSLVDTTVVGRYPPKLAAIRDSRVPLQTLELASLGPATLLCDTAIYLTYFLAIATTNQLAIATAKQDYTLQTSTTSHVLGLGFTFGSIILVLIQVFGKSILTMILGSDGAIVGGFDYSQTVISAAWDYSKIRGIAAPLVVAGIMAQSVCLATLDTLIPSLAVMVATLTNVIGDFYLVYFRGMGARGAAIATAMAGAISSLILLASVRLKMKHWTLKENAQFNRTIRGNKIRPFMSLPNSADFFKLARLSGPIFFVMVGKLICYSAMTIRASDYGMLELASHSIMLRIFYFFCTLGDSLSQAVQSFLPSLIFGKSPTGRTREQKGVSFLKRMLALGAFFAIFNAFASQFILRNLGYLFTTDTTILSLLRKPQYILSLAFGLGLHPIIMCLEGSIMAAGDDFSFLMKSYSVSLIVMLLQLNFFANNLAGIWGSLVVFQVLRLFSFGWRVYSNTVRKGSHQ